jgi:hypothetical protein
MLTLRNHGSAHFAVAFYVLALAVANHSVFRLGALSIFWTIALIAVVAAVVVSAPSLKLQNEAIRPPQPLNLLIGAVALAPLAASVILGWHREFPFSGDQGFHLKQTLYMAFWWLSPAGSAPLDILGRVLSEDSVRQLLAQPLHLLASRAVILLVGLVVVGCCYVRNRLAGLVVALVFIVAWGLLEQAIYYRYPGLWYFWSIPFVGLGSLAGNIDLGGRIATAASAFIWLFALRPWLLGRWPDVAVLPLVAVVLWQRDALYYFDSAYLEPWAVVFALLAAETLIARPRDGAPLACLLIGLAAAVKEPLILALPFVWLAGEPWRGPWLRRIELTAAALAAGFPFLLYFAARRSLSKVELPMGRGVDLDASAEAIASYAREFFNHLSASFAGTGALVAILALAAILLMLWRARGSACQIALVAGGGVAIMLLFAVDRGSLPYAGYFRFLLCSIPFLAVGVIALGHESSAKVAAIIGIVALALQVPDAVTAVGRSTGPPSARNFVEHYDSPIVFPLKSLIAEARQKGVLPNGSTVLANTVHDAMKPVPGIDVTFGPRGKLYCECSAEHPNVMALFVRYLNTNAPFASRPPPNGETFAPSPDDDRLWRAQRDERPTCAVRLRATCRHVIMRIEGDELVGALGIR